MNLSGFAYAVGRVRVLEMKLLTPGDVERMLWAKDAAEAYRVMNDLDFSSCKGNPNDVRDFQRVINEELAETKKLLTGMVNKDFHWVMSVLWIRYDLHNFKIGLKAKILGWSEEQAKEMLLDLGNFPAEEVYAFGRNGTSRFRDERFLRIREEAEKVYAEKKELTHLDYFLDKEMQEEKLILAKKTRNKFILEFVQKEIDLYNIITFFRLKQWQDKDAATTEFWVEGGTLAHEVFGGEMEEVLARLKRTAYAKLARGYELFLQDKVFFAALEREGEDILVEHMRQTKHLPFGPEPIFSYYWMKKENARDLREIMVAKLTGLSEEKMRARLHKLYFD